MKEFTTCKEANSFLSEYHCKLWEQSQYHVDDSSIPFNAIPFQILSYAIVYSLNF